MIAGVAIEPWKLRIFKRHLDGAGFSYTEHGNLDDDMMILKVETTSAAALAPTIKAAVAECNRSKMN